jgi:hypothetical protein
MISLTLKSLITAVHASNHIIMSIVHYRTDQYDRIETGMILHQTIDAINLPDLLEQGKKHTTDLGLVF